MSEHSQHEVPRQNLSTRRRQAFVGLGVVTAGAGLTLAGAHGAVESAKDQAALMEKAPELTPPVTIGNLDVFPLPVSHSGEYWDRWGARVVPLVEKFPMIIPEYVYTEYAHLESSPNPFVAKGIAEYREANRLFEGLESVYRTKEGTQVWRVDPSWGVEFAQFREMILRPPQHLIAAVSGALGVDALAGAGPVFGKNKMKMTRRDFLRWLMVGGLSATLDAVAFPKAESRGLLGRKGETAFDPAMTTERDFRRVIVAEHLSNLGENLKERSSGVTIYHPDHWRVIEQYLRDPGKRKTQLEKYRVFQKIEKLAPLFEARKYIVQNGNLEMVERVQLAKSNP